MNGSLDLDVVALVWWIDPDGFWLSGWNGAIAHETFRVSAERGIEHQLACGMDGVGLAMMNLIRGHQSNSRMMVVAIVPIEEPRAEIAGLVDGIEALWKFRLIFQGVELRLGKRLVV